MVSMQTGHSKRSLRYSSISLEFWFLLEVAIFIFHGLVECSYLVFEFFLKTISIYASSVIIGVITFIPGGLGITEGSLVGLFTLEGIDVSLALILSIIIRLVTLWYSVSIGFIGLKLSGGLSLSKNFKD